MLATYVQPKRTPIAYRDYADALEDALGGDGKVDWKPIAVLMAHATLETGRDVRAGALGPSMWNNNPGNKKRAPNESGFYTCIRLNEYLVRNGKRRLVWFSPAGEEPLVGTPLPVPPGHPQTRMCAFDSISEGVRDKIAFLKRERFQRAWAAAMRGDPDAYVIEIHAQKYFTADLDPYRRAVTNLAHSYEQIAKRTASEPRLLSPSKETEIDLVIQSHAASPSMLDLTSADWVEAVQLDLSQTIDWTGMRK